MSATSMLIQIAVPILAVFFVSFISAYDRHNRSFSLNIFLASIVIGIGILIWIGIAPFYTIVISILIIVGMFFMRGE